MKEKSVAMPAFKETPVLDPNLYLLDQKNSDFLRHKTTAPVFLRGPNTVALLAFAGAILTALAVMLFFVIGNPVLVFALLSIIILLSIFIATRGASSRNPGRAWVLDGKILQAETIRISTYDGRALAEKVRIKYQFVTPQGIIKEAVLESNNMNATQLMAPAPDIPVRIWYTENGKYTLL